MAKPIPQPQLAAPLQAAAPSIVRRTFSSLRHRNFRLYFIGQMVSNTGNWLTNVAITLLVLKITGSGLRVGVLAACQYGPLVILSPYAGALADRYSKRRSLIITQTLEMAQSIGLTALAFAPHQPLIALYVLALAGGVFLAFDNPLRRSFVTEMVAPESLPNAIVLYSTIVNGSRVFGPALAGLLITTVGYGWCFAVDAASYVAVLTCLFLMRENELHRSTKAAERKGAVRAGLRYVMSTPPLWISFALLAVVGTLSYNFNVTLPMFVTQVLHRGDRAYTLLVSTMSAGAVVCSLLIAHRGLTRMRHIIVGAALLGMTMLMLAPVSSVLLAGPIVFFVGMAGILYMTATTAIAQVEAKPEMHGRVLALQTVLIGGPLALGGPLLGWLADTFGGRAPMILGGVVAVVAAAVGWCVSRRYRLSSDP
ncbi:MAG TPA: MFS transporter [Gemmatimonadaceae bacterium]|jgi:MFS family permease|nr:MFS transporter [Gemmatimonadaceae bacterium]